MAALAFLWVDGIKGGSQDSHHLGDIDIESFSFGHNGGVKASLQRAGPDSHFKASVNDMNVVKKLDNTSALLANASASGRHFPTMILTLEKAVGGRSSGEYMRYVMRDVIISSYMNWGSSAGDEVPREMVGLSFDTIEWKAADQH
jgi:type VI secretion system secreted protein Hcp